MKPLKHYFGSSIIFVFFAIFGCSKQTNDALTARKIAFNADWNFHLNDSITDNDTIGSNTKWRTLNVPHDWSIEGKFDEKDRKRDDEEEG